MASKHFVNGQERFDGFAIAVYDGKFAGGFDLDEDLAKDIGFDDVVTFIVTGRVGGVSIGETKTGDVKRTNTFQVTSSVTLEPQVAAKVLNSLGAAVNGVNAGQLSLDNNVDMAATFDDDDDLDPVPATTGAGVPMKDNVLARFLEGDE